MFGANEIVGMKFFRQSPEAQAEKLLIASIFFTLQGEGPYTGRPAIFVRLAKCNLACSFCDTYFDQGDWMTFDEIETSIGVALESYFYPDHVPAWVSFPSENQMRQGAIGLVITGGEPLLQRAVVAFANRQLRNFGWVQIETNGLVEQPLLSKRIALVVSPKCSERDGVPKSYLKPSDLTLRRAMALKFVLAHPGADPDYPYASIPGWAHEWRRDAGGVVYVSPMNIYSRLPAKANSGLADRSEINETISFWEPGLLDQELNQRNHEWAAQYVLRHGLRLSLQTHLYASLP